MPLATINLFALANPRSLPSLLKHIKASNAKPLVISKPIRWVIRPEHIGVSSLLTPKWDLLVILEDNAASKELISSILNNKSDQKVSFNVKDYWTTRAGIPSRLTKDFLKKINPSLLHQPQSEIPELTGALSNPLVKSSSQDLSLSSDLQSWINTNPVSGAVSMLNLLSFRPGHKPSYLKYGKAFAETIGAKRGGNAKLVGNIVHDDLSNATQGEGEKEGIWHEFALAHYPSLMHFADMLASEDYQAVNQKYRVPALADTCILCTSELEIEKMLSEIEGGGGRAKL